MSFNTIYTTAEFISNALAIPVLLLCLCVIMIWAKPAFFIFKQKSFNDLLPHEWFIIGVFVSFVGEFIDNLYWTIVWSAVFIEHTKAINLMTYGVFPNIPLRQIFGIIAAACHVRSAVGHVKGWDSKSQCSFKMLLLGSILLGFIYSLTLLVIQW